MCGVCVVCAAYGALQHGEKLNGVCVCVGGGAKRETSCVRLTTE